MIPGALVSSVRDTQRRAHRKSVTPCGLRSTRDHL